MSLSGNLGFVPIDEVLGLLTRSSQESAVEVSGLGLFGRVYVGKGGIALATTVKDAELQRQLANTGYVDADSLRLLAGGQETLADIAPDNEDVIALLREMTVESLYRISQGGDDFQVREGATSRFGSPRLFDLDELLRETDTREKDWEKIHEIVPDLKAMITFNRELGDRDEVTIKADDWRVLAALGTGSSVEDISDRLGVTEFRAASITSRLVKYDLLAVGAVVEEYEPEQVFDEEPSDEPGWGEAPQEDQVDELGLEPSYVAPTADAPLDEMGDLADPTVAEPSMAESRITVPVEAEVQSEPAQDAEDVDPNQSWWQEPSKDESSSDEEVEEDTEAFLEKVFSELETSESDETEGFGLLRRRRIGSLRDFSSDS